MKFKIGSSVEVFSEKKVPSGAWRCAEMVAYIGDGYAVRYYRSPGIAKSRIHKVTTESVRPCPPLSTASVNWAVGDVVEVLDDGYWMVSMIDRVLGEDSYYIHVIGSIDEFKVRKSSIRLRQEWRDKKWVLIEKDSVDCEGSSDSEDSSDCEDSVDCEESVDCEDLISEMRGKACTQQAAESSSKSLKRSFIDISSGDEAYSEGTQKRRTVNYTYSDSYSFVGNVDVDSYPRANVVKDNLQLLTKEAIKFMDGDSRNHRGAVLLAESPESDDCDLLRHGSLTAAYILMMSWLATSSLVSKKGHHQCWLLCR